MCQYFYTDHTQCNCFLEDFEPRSRPSFRLFAKRNAGMCDVCQVKAFLAHQQILRRGTLAQIAEQHDQSRGLDNHTIYKDNPAELTKWLSDENHPLPELENPDPSLGIFLSPGFAHWLDSGRTMEECREKRQASPPEPGLDYGQGFKITPPPEAPSPDAQPQTRTKTHRVSDWKVGEYDLTARNTVLTQSQRDTLATIGHRGIRKINVISRRKINVTRHDLSANQRGALYDAGHKNLERITVVTNRRDGSSGESYHPLSARQRAALREAGHGNLRALVVKGRHPKTPSN